MVMWRKKFIIYFIKADPVKQCAKDEFRADGANIIVAKTLAEVFYCLLGLSFNCKKSGLIVICLVNNRCTQLNQAFYFINISTCAKCFDDPIGSTRLIDNLDAC